MTFSILQPISGQETPPSPINPNFPIQIDPPTVIKSSIATGMYLLGPDPKDLAQMYPLLHQQSIRTALQLNDDQVNAIQAIDQDHRDRLRDLGAPRTFEEARDPKRNTLEAQVTIAIRKERAQVLEEILLPEQLTRLRQICYRYDVSARGLVTALTEGRLREAANVYDNQITHLQQKGKEIEQRALRDIETIMKRAEEEVLAELSTEQRKLAKAALGDYFKPEDADAVKIGVKKSQERRKLRQNSSPPSEKSR